MLITSKRIVGAIVFSSSKTFLLADREDDIPLKYQREVSGVLHLTLFDILIEYHPIS